MQIDHKALEQFTDYFVRNYPGPDTIIHDPKWHAPKIFRAALAALSQAEPAALVGQEGAARLYDADEPMADGEIRMTAAEDVLGWLLIEKLGVPDDRNYTPNEASTILSHRLDAAREMENALVKLALSPAPAGVHVKALEWEQPDGPNGTSWLGHGTDMCQYYIRLDGDQWVMPGDADLADLHGDDTSAEHFSTLEAAKAAAQADYETRIRSALIAPPSAGGQSKATLSAAEPQECE